MKITEVLKIGKEILEKNNIDTREARLLLAFVLNVKKEKLPCIMECTENEVDKYMEVINKRLSGIPYAYIVGNKEFMKLKFTVNENVLIPRSDTEILVEKIIELKKENLKILEIGTGSGCISISLAKYLNNAHILAVDISDKALEVAKKNAIDNHVDVKFIKSNLFENVVEKYDLIVSNPPYIRTKEILNLDIDVQKEPILALDGGENGLYFYKNIIENSNKYLNSEGILAFEIGYDQGNEVKQLMEENGFENVEIYKDLGKNERVVMGVLKK